MVAVNGKRQQTVAGSGRHWQTVWQKMTDNGRLQKLVSVGGRHFVSRWQIVADRVIDNTR
jgi:hypothetical protein